MTSVPPDLSPSDLERLFSAERLSTYVEHCDGDVNAAIAMYRWNAAITAAFWEPVGHLEVALRNTIDARLAARHNRLERQGSWLDDPERELSDRARLDIASARDRVKQKGKRASDGQTISELSFGFWRFLVAKKLTGLWPDLASGFPHAPDRQLATVEGPLARLHVFRNRLAHHQRVWSHAPEERYGDLLALAGYIDPALPAWISATSTVPQTLTDRP
ncbi:MAG: hypothetical protein ACTHM1_04490 [Solirubrobacteraceae bacterium]